jgi:predicted dehydrogenase
MTKQRLSRREFMRTTVGATVATRAVLLEPKPLAASPRPVAPSDRLRFASVGVGIRGGELLRTALTCRGTEIVAVSDVYDPRFTAAQEHAQKQLDTTKDYRAILDRKDIDVVIVATPDHWHAKIVQDACAAGKDVYCEKPMSHTVEEGFAMVEAARRHNRIVQVGSQYRSSIVFAKAKEIYDSGILGQVTAIEAIVDRNTPEGAGIWPVAPGASERTIDWNTFLGDARKCPFDPMRFFRWRAFWDYGEGLAGDLYVHLITGYHYVASLTAPPSRATTVGGLFRWKEHREVPDILWTLYEYPDLRVGVRSNMNNESPLSIAFYGTQGTLEIKDDVVAVFPQNILASPENYPLQSWPSAMRNEYLKHWHEAHPSPAPGSFRTGESARKFIAPSGYDDSLDHMSNFLECVRSRRPPVEDAEFGNVAAIACHMANYAYLNKTIATWDTEARRIKG